MAILHTIFDALPQAPGESVWSYPEIPRIERCPRMLRVCHNRHVVASTTRGLRVLEHGHPPVYFFPLEDADTDCLAMARGHTWYPRRGQARFFDVVVDGRRSPLAAWTHPQPDPSHIALKGHVAFYAGRVDGAFVDGEQVIPQPGGVFGGWITADVIGPFKGGGNAWS